MKLYSVIAFRWREDGPPVTLTSSYELSSFGFFQRGSAREVCTFVSREVVQRSRPGDRHSVLHKEHVCHVWIQADGLSCAVVTDEEYPARVAFSLILKTLEGYKNTEGDAWKAINADTDKKMPQLDALILKYQDPKEADDILRIQRDLDDVKDSMIRNIDQLLERGEKLDTLMERSEDLSFQSKAFLKETERYNCCTLL